TPNGKVDRAALPAPELSGAVVHADPWTPEEAALAGIWAEVLQTGMIGIHDNFFDLGGHSLLATQVMSRVQQTFKVDLPLRRLFEAPTVAEFASVIENAIKTAVRSVDSIPVLSRDAHRVRSVV